MVYPLNISVTKDIVTIFDRKHPLFLSETTSCVYIEKFILASGFKHVKRFLGVFYLRCKILIKSDISMNDCYLNFLVSFRALFSLDVGANLVNSKLFMTLLPDIAQPVPMLLYNVIRMNLWDSVALLMPGHADCCLT